MDLNNGQGLGPGTDSDRSQETRWTPVSDRTRERQRSHNQSKVPRCSRATRGTPRRAIRIANLNQSLGKCLARVREAVRMAVPGAVRGAVEVYLVAGLAGFETR